jgi:serine/threonine protein kinase/Tol biopolymer transport system component
MDPQQWKAIERLYYACIELPVDQRSRHLNDACEDDEVRQQVASLLVHRDRGLSVIERPALDVAADLVGRTDQRVLVGRSIGPYLVTALIGAGGMGVVYRAHDRRLERDVALKLLPGDVANESDRLSRIEQEARLLASLSHPSIGAIYDLEESNGIRCLVLEFIEGETLDDRLQRGRMHLDEGLRICRQIAEALEAAHERGIVHRDLKPSNVMIGPNASVKVLDFGIASMLAATPSTGTAVGVGSSAAGAVAGTPSYVSPEQACGMSVDKRTDIWAFGCVLYEVLTGRKAFERASVADTLAAVIEQEPDWNALPRSTPQGIVDLLHRCLHKNPQWRLRDIGDARIDLVEHRARPGQVVAAERRVLNQPWLWMAAIAALVLFASLITWAVRPVPSAPEIRLELTTPPSTDPVSLAISPDGRKVVFVATHEGRSRLWLRPLDSLSARPLERTDHAACPFWSPDATSVGFFADGQLKRVDVQSGAVEELIDALPCGGTWNRDGTILYSRPLFGPISRIPAAKVAPAAARVEVTHVDAPRQRIHRFPQFLPDDRHFLYFVGGSADVRGVYLGDLGGTEPRRLMDADTAAVYAAGHLLFVRQGALVAQAFDATRLTAIGESFQVADRVVFDPARFVAAVSAASAGPIVFRPGSVTGSRQFVWFARTGRELDRIGEPDTSGSLDPSLSPDEQRVAFYRTVNAQPDVWLLDTRRGARTRFTISGRALRPIWSPDGREMIYASGRPTNLYRRPLVGQADEQAILETNQPKAATDWSRDGRWVLYRSNDEQTGWDLWALPLDATRQPLPLLRTRFDERDGQFSPDAKWIAYQSNESGRFEIYVQPFGRTGAKVPVSRDGGAQVRWRADGKELFYVAFDNRLMAVPVHAAADNQTFEVGTPIALFTTQIGGAVQSVNRQQYMVAADGERFLMNTVLEDATSPLVVLMNWPARR